jgi:hypothetical protein
MVSPSLGWGKGAEEGIHLHFLPEAVLMAALGVIRYPKNLFFHHRKCRGNRRLNLACSATLRGYLEGFDAELLTIGFLK